MSARLQAIAEFDDSQVGTNFDYFGLEATGFILFQKTQNTGLASNGFPYAVGEPYVSAGSGQPITLPEIHPGVPVELDFDDEGRLSVIRAAVVR